MSFDDGDGSMMNSDADFRARFVGAMTEAGLTFNQLCAKAGVDTVQAKEAIAKGTYGLPATLPILQCLLRALGLDESYLFGSYHQQAPTGGRASTVDRRRQVRTLAWDFGLRSSPKISNPRIRQLADYCANLINVRPSTSVLQAARPPIPRTTLDVAFIYKRLDQQGYFDRIDNGSI